MTLRSNDPKECQRLIRNELVRLFNRAAAYHNNLMNRPMTRSTIQCFVDHEGQLIDELSDLIDSLKQS